MLQCFRREMHDSHPQTCDCNSGRLIDAATEKQAECSLFSQRDCKAALGILLSQQQGRLTFVGCTLARSCRSTHRLSHCLASCRLSPPGSRESSEVETPPPEVTLGITLGRPTSSPPSSASPTPRLLSATSTVRPPPTPRILLFPTSSSSPRKDLTRTTAMFFRAIFQGASRRPARSSHEVGCRIGA